LHLEDRDGFPHKGGVVLGERPVGEVASVVEANLCRAAETRGFPDLYAYAARMQQANHLDGVLLVEADRAIVRNDGPRIDVPMPSTTARRDPCARANAHRHAGNRLANGRQARANGIRIARLGAVTVSDMYVEFRGARRARTDRASAASTDAETGTHACTDLERPPLRQG
jgi:hypothetical protein